MIELDVIRKLAFTDPVPFEVFEIYGFPNGRPKGQYEFNSFKENKSFFYMLKYIKLS